ncbi:P4Hc domain-containing protein, partial [Durusdinium trenchii]
ESIADRKLANMMAGAFVLQAAPSQGCAGLACSANPVVKVCRSDCCDAVSKFCGMQYKTSLTAACFVMAFRRSRQVICQSKGFGGASRDRKTTTTKPVKEVFATSEIEVAKFKQEVLSYIDQWCDELIAGLRDHGWWASNGPSLPPSLCRALRKEVEDLWHQGHFIKSQSVLGGTVYYDKKNVYATEVTRDRYLLCPRMWHYTVVLTQELTRRVNLAFPKMDLSDKFIGNKLNMSVGNGASFDAHLDVGVAEKPFNRKLSLLVYLNDSWRPSLGGEITLLGEGETELEAANAEPARLGLPVTISPISGRLVAFWSDRILHKVQA